MSTGQLYRLLKIGETIPDDAVWLHAGGSVTRVYPLSKTAYAPRHGDMVVAVPVTPSHPVDEREDGDHYVNVPNWTLRFGDIPACQVLPDGARMKLSAFLPWISSIVRKLSEPHPPAPDRLAEALEAAIIPMEAMSLSFGDLLSPMVKAAIEHARKLSQEALRDRAGDGWTLARERLPGSSESDINQDILWWGVSMGMEVGYYGKQPVLSTHWMRCPAPPAAECRHLNMCRGADADSCPDCGYEESARVDAAAETGVLRPGTVREAVFTETEMKAIQDGPIAAIEPDVIAHLKQECGPYPFNLTRALRGDALVTRGGVEAKNFRERRAGVFLYIADVKRIPNTYTQDGRSNEGSNDHAWDLFMRDPEPSTPPVPEDCPICDQEHCICGLSGASRNRPDEDEVKRSVCCGAECENKEFGICPECREHTVFESDPPEPPVIQPKAPVLYREAKCLVDEHGNRPMLPITPEGEEVRSKAATIRKNMGPEACDFWDKIPKAPESPADGEEEAFTKWKESYLSGPHILHDCPSETGRRAWQAGAEWRQSRDAEAVADLEFHRKALVRIAESVSGSSPLCNLSRWPRTTRKLTWTC